MQIAINGAQGRDFNAYVRRMQEDNLTHKSVEPVSALATSAPQIAPQAPAPAEVPRSEVAPPIVQAQAASTPVAAPAVSLEALRSKDLTAYSDEQLSTICQAKGYDLAAVLALRAEQQLLKDFEGV